MAELVEGDGVDFGGVDLARLVEDALLGDGAAIRTRATMVRNEKGMRAKERARPK